MTRDEIRQEMHRILDSHDAALSALRMGSDALRASSDAMLRAHQSIQETFTAHDAVLVSAIEANRAAIRLLNRIQDEGVAP